MFVSIFSECIFLYKFGKLTKIIKKVEHVAVGELFF